jgi:hypothetical protein
MRFGHDPATGERVRAVDFGLRPDLGAPLPVLVQSEHRTFLAFYLSAYDPDWDGTWVTIVDPTDADAEEPLGVIEFLGCDGAVLGGLNDEAIHGHPLWSTGLEDLRDAGGEVLDSAWIAELERANSVHPNHTPALFAHLRHFVLLLHDSTFECVAGGFRSYQTRQSMPSLVTLLAGVVNGRDALELEVVKSDRGMARRSWLSEGAAAGSDSPDDLRG